MTVVRTRLTSGLPLLFLLASALVVTSPLGGQERGRRALGVWDVPVDSLLTILRSGPDAATSLSGKLQSHILREPDQWPRARVDSLASGVIRFLLEAPYFGKTATIVRILVVEAPNGARVGTAEQLILLADAGRSVENLMRASIIAKMAYFADDPVIVEYLASIATSEGEVDSRMDRSRAVRALTASSRGRDRLRRIWAEGLVHDRWARSLMERLSRRDFADSVRGSGGS